MTDSSWLIAVPVCVSVAYGMLRVNYSRFKALEEIICGLRSELSEAQQRLDARIRLQEQKAHLGQIIHDLRTSMFVATTSDENRSALMAVQNSAAAWLAENIGVAEAHAFVAAERSWALPSTLRFENAGTYQEASGRLSFLVRLVGALGSG